LAFGEAWPEGAPEVWKPVPGHRGYQASSWGRTRSVPRKLKDGRTAGGVVLAQQDDKDGYPTVKMTRGQRVRVAVAVQLAFAGPPEVRHLDGDRSNSRPGNLAWGSRVENEQDKRRTESRSGTEEGCSRPSRVGTSPVTAVTDGR
jgi:NUMOD4 motif/HNH endonuclease